MEVYLSSLAKRERERDFSLFILYTHQRVKTFIFLRLLKRRWWYLLIFINNIFHSYSISGE
jgi:hypothetical protein